MSPGVDRPGARNTGSATRRSALPWPGRQQRRGTCGWRSRGALRWSDCCRGTVLVGVALIAIAGCAAKDKDEAKEPASNPENNQLAKADSGLCDVTGKRVQTFDLNRDRVPDVWKIYERTQEGDTAIEALSCRQVDFDHDGRKDYVAVYTSKGGKRFESFDFDFDGRFDALHRFDETTGNLTEVQRDSDFDGRYDLLEIYDESGSITAIKRDRNADGAPDLWEQYVAGELVAILYDDNYDNQVDRRDEVEVAAPKPAGEDDLDSDSADSSEPPEQDQPPNSDTPDRSTPDRSTPDRSTLGQRQTGQR